MNSPEYESWGTDHPALLVSPARDRAQRRHTSHRLTRDERSLPRCWAGCRMCLDAAAQRPLVRLRRRANPSRLLPSAASTNVLAPELLRGPNIVTLSAALRLADNVTYVNAHERCGSVGHVTQAVERRLRHARIRLRVEEPERVLHEVAVKGSRPVRQLPDPAMPWIIETPPCAIIERVLAPRAQV